MLKPPPNLAVSVSYKYDLANLIEFVEYHRLVGVNKIYLCNNDSNPIVTQRVLRNHIDSGFVEHIHSAPMFHQARNRQAEAHRHVLRLARRDKAKWLSMLDMDEFLYPIKYDTVTEVLKDYEKCAVLQISYACFGSSGCIRKQMLQTNSYINRAKDGWFWNHLSKSIGRVERIQDCSHHHYFTPVHPHMMMDENKKISDWVHPPKYNHLRINHYLSRSKEDYKEKMRRGNPIGEKRDWKWFAWADRNEVHDEGMRQRFVPKLLEVLHNNKNWYTSKGIIKFI